ncbi:MAG: hypothetical protein DRG24_06080 [Epsilonproteobacteria bacterium]|nr:MAG: hypothetical protein DRG24_06080 [Campylobacterota bacterium]
MKQVIIQQQCPVNVEEIAFSETTYESVDEIINMLKAKIEADPHITYISTFDHYDHTACLPHGKIANGITAAKNLLFCFGPMIPNPYMMALKPRSMGITQTTDGFVIAFAEAPLPIANSTMSAWAQSIKNL